MTINSDIDKLFKKGLNDYVESPPAFIWEEVESALKRRKAKRQRNRWYSAAAVIALLISFGSGYLLTNLNNDPLIADNVPEVENVAVEQAKIDNTTTELPIVNEQNTDVEAVENEEVVKAVAKPQVLNKIEPKNIKSKVKKVNSSGTLLPPMFASEGVVDEDETPRATSQAMSFKIEEQKLEPISEKALAFKMADDFKNIKYNAAAYQQMNNAQAFVVKEKAKVKNWTVGINASPLVSFRDVYAVDQQAMASMNVLNSDNQNYKNEKPLVAYAAGVDVGFRIGKRWNIQSGFYISEMGQISENVDLHTVSTFNNSLYDSYSINTSAGNMVVKGSPSDMIDVIAPGVEEVVAVPAMPRFAPITEEQQPVNADFVQVFDYYEVPVVLNYKLVDRKFAVDLSGGVSANFMYGSASYLQDNSVKYELDAEIEGLNTTSYSGMFGVGFAFPIVKSLKIKLNPTFRYSLSPINANGTVYPYSFGVFTGIKYSF